MELVMMVLVRMEWVTYVGRGGNPQGVYARTYVRTLIPKTYIENGHKLTRVRTCVFSGPEAFKLLPNSFQKAPTRHKIIHGRWKTAPRRPPERI